MIKGCWIARPRLVRSLVEARGAPVVLIEAPAGYGKTRLLSEWLASERERRPVAWLSFEACDSADPTRPLAQLVATVRQIVPGFGRGIDPGLHDPGSPSVESVLPRLIDELASLPQPLIMALDDCHLLRGGHGHELLGRLATALPSTLQLAIATRSDPGLPLARLRARGELVELHAADLRFDEDEASALLAASGVVLDQRSGLSTLVGRTEGWPVGLSLATRALEQERDLTGFVARFAGTNRHVADYLSEEVLRHQSPAVRSFLVRTSILGRLCGQLCDAILDRVGSQAVIEHLERANAFIVPLDDERRWYRYHRLFGEMLQAELHRTEPGLAAELHGRASAWFDVGGSPELAAQHALAALRRTSAGRPISGTDLEATRGPSGRADEAELPRRQRVAAQLDFGQRLTDREMTILRLLPTSLSQREIARELFVSVNTVKTHSRAIYRKLGVSSRGAATERAWELELLRPPRAHQSCDGALAS